jgi:Ca2+-binding EF-hand superfamily protein
MTKGTAMKTTVLLGAAALLALTAALPASAHDRRAGMGLDALFERLDADGDGRITREEVAAARAARIAALDADGNGIVTRDEAIAFARAEAAARAEWRAGVMFDRADADGDGRLTAAELMAGGGMPGGMDFGRMFERLDRDGDGAVSRAEAEAAMRAFRGGERRGPMGHRHGPGHGGN